MSEPDMTHPDAVGARRANTDFYLAFAGGDLAAMERLWAQRAPVACIHPGWSPLTGRDAVMASWRAILGRPPAITADVVDVLVLGHAVLVLCREIIGDTVLAVSNLYVSEDGVWRMAHHHAGPSPREQPRAAERTALH